MNKFRFFAILFLKVDYSINIEARLFKSCVFILYIIMEGTVSQIFLLGSSSYSCCLENYFYKFYKIFCVFLSLKRNQHILFFLDLVTSIMILGICTHNLKSAYAIVFEKIKFEKKKYKFSFFILSSEFLNHSGMHWHIS